MELLLADVYLVSVRVGFLLDVRVQRCSRLSPRPAAAVLCAVGAGPALTAGHLLFALRFLFWRPVPDLDSCCGATADPAGSSWFQLPADTSGSLSQGTLDSTH